MKAFAEKEEHGETMSKDNNKRIMYNINELQEILGVGRNLAYKLAQSRNFPKIVINGRYFFPKDQVHKWVSQKIGKDFRV